MNKCDADSAAWYGSRYREGAQPHDATTPTAYATTDCSVHFNVALKKCYALVDTGDWYQPGGDAAANSGPGPRASLLGCGRVPWQRHQDILMRVPIRRWHDDSIRSIGARESMVFYLV
jgi:hypothetical protein